MCAHSWLPMAPCITDVQQAQLQHAAQYLEFYYYSALGQTGVLRLLPRVLPCSTAMLHRQGSACPAKVDPENDDLQS